MANKLITATIYSDEDKSEKEVQFIMDEQLYKDIKILSKEQQLKYYTEYYREDSRLSKIHRRELSIFDDNIMEEVDSKYFEDPKEFYDKKEVIDAVNKAVNNLNQRQKYIIQQVFYKNRKQVDVAKELGLTRFGFGMFLKRTLAKLKSELEEKI